MTDPIARLRRFLRELKRRNVYKVAVTYAVVAFVVAQAANLFFPALQFPAWTIDFVIVLTLLGFPIALVLAWAFEMTPEGVHRTSEVEGEPAGSAYQWIGLILVVALAGGVWFLMAGDGGEATTEATATMDTSTRTALPAARDTAGPPRIAVLPFENIAPDSTDDYFAQGMHEEVLNQLSKVSGLEVISRTSVMRYADTDKPVRAISEELGGVNALLEGTVRRAGERVRITTQLIDAPEDEHLWSNTYERTLSVEEIFDIQADIAEQVVAALQTELAGSERRRIESAPTDSFAAYNAYLEGRSDYFRYAATRQPGDITQSVDRLREAVRRDPSFAEASAWLGLAYAFRSGLGDKDRWLDSATVAVRRAKAIEPNLAAAHLAQARIYRERDSTSARIASLRRAIKLQPSHAVAKAELSEALRFQGRYVEAIRVAHEATQLAPRQPVVLEEMTQQLISAGFYDAAAAWSRRILEIEPGHFAGILGLSDAQMARGRYAQALETWQDYLEETEVPVPFALHVAAFVALSVGQAERAKAYLERIPRARRRALPKTVESPSEAWFFSPRNRASLGLAELCLGNRERGRRLLRHL